MTSVPVRSQLIFFQKWRVGPFYSDKFFKKKVTAAAEGSGETINIITIQYLLKKLLQKPDFSCASYRKK
jgi:hypothetical protein